MLIVIGFNFAFFFQYQEEVQYPGMFHNFIFITNSVTHGGKVMSDFHWIKFNRLFYLLLLLSDSVYLRPL